MPINSAWFYTMTSVTLVSGLSLTGLFFISMDETRLMKILLFMVSFAVGGLFGDAFLHLLPEAFAKMGTGPRAPLLALGGIFMFFILEKFLSWRHCHVPTSERHPHPMVFMNLIGDAVHNFIDGAVIGASYLISVHVGLATTLAVVLHEIPHEIGDYGVLVHGGFSPKKALVFNFLTALTALAGGAASLVIGAHFVSYTYAAMPLTAGGFIYIAGSDLVPALHEECSPAKSLLQLVFIFLGIGIMSLLLLLG
jgi:zinc and cadmium transporter